MNELRKFIKGGATVLGLLLLAAFLTGCSTPTYKPLPDENGVVRGPVDVFNKGDLVVVDFSLPGNSEKKRHEERVKEDGNINPPEIQAVEAEGKSPGELQKELQTQYSKLYPHITVTVKSGDRFYHVDGEVRTPGPKPYLGQTDVVKAIAAAGGFTEFARKGKIRLIRADGTTEIVDYEEAIDDPAKNLPVYPNDKIVVRRRIL